MSRLAQLTRDLPSSEARAVIALFHYARLGCLYLQDCGLRGSDCKKLRKAEAELKSGESSYILLVLFLKL